MSVCVCFILSAYDSKGQLDGQLNDCWDLEAGWLYQVDVTDGRGYATDGTQWWGFFRLPNSHCSSNSYTVAIMNQDGGLGVNGWHYTHDNMDIGRREWLTLTAWFCLRETMVIAGNFRH